MSQGQECYIIGLHGEADRLWFLGVFTDFEAARDSLEIAACRVWQLLELSGDGQDPESQPSIPVAFVRTTSLNRVQPDLLGDQGTFWHKRDVYTAWVAKHHDALRTTQTWLFADNLSQATRRIESIERPSPPS